MNRNMIFVAIAALFVTGNVYAERGGEGGNTGCNGVGNHNSPCQPNTPPPNTPPPSTTGRPPTTVGICLYGAGGPCNSPTATATTGPVTNVNNNEIRNTNTNLNNNANNNTNTNTNSNTNTNTNSNTNTNVNSNVNLNTNTQHQSQSQAQTQSIENSGNSSSTSSATGGSVSNSGNSSSTATGGSVSNSGNSSATGGSATGGSVANSGNTAGNSSSSITINEAAAPDKVTVKSAPNVAAPGLASAINNDLCVVSASFGGSGIGFGLAIGMQYRDEDCVRRVNARQLYNMGYQKAAVVLMAQDPNVRKALEDAGEVLPPSSTPVQPQSQIGQFPSVVVR